MGIPFLILGSIWFLLPAYAANMAPVFAKKIHFLDFPLDSERKLWGNPLFGKNKTMRGFFFGILASLVITYVQLLLYNLHPFFRHISIFDYNSIKVYALGFFMGTGALAGDLVKSFFKRRLGIPVGKPWIPFDQLDYIIGTVLFIMPIYTPRPKYLAVMIILSMLLHPAANIAGYYLGIKKNKL